MWKIYLDLVLSSEITVWVLVIIDTLLLLFFIKDHINREKNAYMFKKKSELKINKFLSFWSRNC